MIKRLFTVLGSLLLVCSLPLSGLAASNQPFLDVPSTKHFAEAVNNLAERNIIGGYPDGTFKPGNSITRGQAAAIIAKMIGLDTKTSKNPGFTDVSKSHGFYKAIAAMAEKGIIGGYQDGSYKPNDPINRKNMAAILVKAFDLPRDADIENPFKDPSGITTDVLIIYKLGITTGTTPTTFSPNAFITRGQAAKMLKATEEVNVQGMVTKKASDFGFTSIETIETGQLGSEVFKGIVVHGKAGYTEDKIQLIPLKEGKGALLIRGTNSGTPFENLYKKFYVVVKEINGKLTVTLEETKDLLTTKVEIWTPAKDVQSISLSTMEGKKLSDRVDLLPCASYQTCFEIDKAGQYIATVRYKNGSNVRYGVEAEEVSDSFYYKIRTVEEQTSAVYTDNENYAIGKHTFNTTNHEQIATVTRDPGSNTFRATGKNEGWIEIEFEHTTNQGTFCDGADGISGTCSTYYVTGMAVEIEKIGSIIHVSIIPRMMSDH